MIGEKLAEKPRNKEKELRYERPTRLSLVYTICISYLISCLGLITFSLAWEQSLLHVLYVVVNGVNDLLAQVVVVT